MRKNGPETCPEWGMKATVGPLLPHGINSNDIRDEQVNLSSLGRAVMDNNRLVSGHILIVY